MIIIIIIIVIVIMIMIMIIIGGFRMDVRLKITFRLRCTCYTCNYAYSAIPRMVRKILKNY
jgi:hypothetical protein